MNVHAANFGPETDVNPCAYNRSIYRFGGHPV